MIDSLLDRLPFWLGKGGSYSDIVIFSEVSLYRNLGGYKFSKRNSEK